MRGDRQIFNLRAVEIGASDTDRFAPVQPKDLAGTWINDKVIPYNTDAPIYHYPIVTGSLIVVNAGLFLGVEFGPLGPIEDWLLRYGDRLHPQQWLVCHFMHLGLGHLLGNMMFLWVFGLITEGKLDWWRFLLSYLALGVVAAAVEQTLLLGYDGPIIGGAGASAAIFGLIGMALVWAPKNDVQCMFGYWIHIIRTGVFDISVATLAGIYLGLNILFLLAHQQLASSEAAHLLGGAVGIGLAVLLLKSGRVDCEGWDLFSLWRGESANTATQEAADEIDRRALQMRRREIEQAPRLIAYFVQQGNPAMALETYRRARDNYGPIALDRPVQLALVKCLLAGQDFAEAIPLLEDLIERESQDSHRLRLKLAELLLKHEQRPQKALKVLDLIPHPRPRELEPVRRRLVEQANEMVAAGVLELEEAVDG